MSKTFKIICGECGCEIEFENKQSSSLSSDNISVYSSVDETVYITCNNKNCKNEIEIW